MQSPHFSTFSQLWSGFRAGELPGPYPQRMVVTDEMAENTEIFSVYWSDNGRRFGRIQRYDGKGFLGMPFFYIKAPDEQTALEILIRRVYERFGTGAKKIGFNGKSVIGSECRSALFSILQIADGESLFSGGIYDA